jgi:hypothetical protein
LAQTALGQGQRAAHKGLIHREKAVLFLKKKNQKNACSAAREFGTS